MKKLNVISLFNGMGTLRQALHDLNIPIGKYYSSEIKPYAIELQQHHFPDVIQVGDITKWKEWDIDWKTIDFIGSGSPCQDLSIAGKRAGINGSRSGLFWVFIDILNHVKKLNPDVLFLQENVGSANKKDIGIMSRAMGLYPVRINSKLVTAQLRDRYYWTNIRTKKDGLFGDIVTDIPQPKDRKIMFKDIITDGSVEKIKAGALMQSDNKQFVKDAKKENTLIQKRILKGKQTPNLVYTENSEIRVKTNTKQGYDVLTENDCLDLSFPTSTTRRGRVTKGKAPCLLEGAKNLYIVSKNGIKKTIIKQKVSVRKHEVDIIGLQKILANRNLTIKEISEKLNIPKTKVEHWFRTDTSFAIPDKEYWEKLKEILNITDNSFDKQIMEFIEKDNEFEQSNRVYHIDGKMPTLTESMKNVNITLNNYTVRTVNQTEMERLQGFPDGYTSILTKAKAGSLLGDGWTLPVIIHILSFANLDPF